jgi:transcriptional regulator with XRE-family HTH domain
MNENKIAQIVGKKIKHLRVDLGISQKKLAQEIGITQCEISLWEQGETIPSSKYLYKICELARVNLGYFDISKDQQVLTPFLITPISTVQSLIFAILSLYIKIGYETILDLLFC